MFKPIFFYLFQLLICCISGYKSFKGGLQITLNCFFKKRGRGHNKQGIHKCYQDVSLRTVTGIKRRGRWNHSVEAGLRCSSHAPFSLLEFFLWGSRWQMSSWSQGEGGIQIGQALRFGVLYYYQLPLHPILP